MIEGMMTNSLLVLGIALLILVINHRSRKHSRALLWVEGITAIIGTLLAIGFRWIRLFSADGYPNFPAVMAVTLVLCAGAIFIVFAEKIHKKTKDMSQIQDKEVESTEVSSKDDSQIESNDVSVLPLKGKLDTTLAHIILKKALEADLMSIEDINDYRKAYHWKGSKVLLAYMCGRIYCGDSSQPLPNSKDIIWNAGKGVFPSNDLDRLFNEKDLGQQRSNRLENRVPKDFEKVDALFA